MKKGIHPDNYRLCVFKDMSTGYAVLTKSCARFLSACRLPRLNNISVGLRVVTPISSACSGTPRTSKWTRRSSACGRTCCHRQRATLVAIHAWCRQTIRGRRCKCDSSLLVVFLQKLSPKQEVAQQRDGAVQHVPHGILARAEEDGHLSLLGLFSLGVGIRTSGGAVPSSGGYEHRWCDSMAAFQPAKPTLADTHDE